jgi:hypothetical protein
MDRATFESQKAFAGERKASMQRRCVDNDYTARRMYMITMVTEGRRPLFAKGFNDQILLRDGQLERWMNYLKDNPRRLLMKRENPDLFKVQRGLTFAGISFSAIGNRFLLERPLKIQVQCSRSISESNLRGFSLKRTG